MTYWLDIHPFKKDPEAFVWIPFQAKSKNEYVSYTTIALMLKSLAKKAGIIKPVNPLSFRHARATHLASKLTEQQLKVTLVGVVALEWQQLMFIFQEEI